MEYTVDHVKDSLERAADRGKEKCALLIGAGCSVKGGIPTAAGVVEHIKEHYRRQYDDASEKTYRACMAQLSRGEKRELIRKLVKDAKINCAHLAIAQLIKHGYVDRVLTTNFDPLLVKACSLVGEFPATYDIATAKGYSRAGTVEPCIFFLHGRDVGHAQVHTDMDFKEHAGLVGPVIEDTGVGRTWIVAGYSGGNDPVFGKLAALGAFDFHLYWVGYLDELPGRHVSDGLLGDPGKDAHLISGMDADGFFVQLAQRLRCFPPDFCRRPFDHLDVLLGSLTPYTPPGENSEIDVASKAREHVAKAKTFLAGQSDVVSDVGIESGDGSTPSSLEKLSVLEVMGFLMAGDFEKVISLRPQYDAGKAPWLEELLVQAYESKGTGLGLSGEKTSGEEADRFFAQAAESFAKAVEIKPDMHDALSKWGNALWDQAKTKSGEEADGLFALAGEKYAKALEIKPDKHDALSNWGNALSDQATTKSGEEADGLLALAGEKYAKALEIKPDEHDALLSWGNSLTRQAMAKTGEEADRLFALAGERYAKALEIKPDKYEALYDWGTALTHEAKVKSGEEADRRFALAGEKYAKALETKPDLREALSNWGSALWVQAKTKSGEEADSLFALAQEKWLKAEQLEAGAGAYNLACLSALQRDAEACRTWLLKGREHGRLPPRARIDKDADLDSVRGCEWFTELVQGASGD